MIVPRTFLLLILTSIHLAAHGQSPWQDQLPKIDPSQHAAAGQWAKSNGQLRTAAAAASRLVIPAKVPREYDFRVQFTRHSGQHSIALIFSAGKGRATYEIDAWGQNLAGIQNISRRTMQQHQIRAGGQRLVNGRKYTAEVRVRRNSVTALLDGNVLATYQGDGSDLSIHEIWRMTPDTMVGVGAYNAATTFHAIELRAVSGDTIAAAGSPTRSTLDMNKSPGNTPANTGTSKPRTGDGRRVLIVIADSHFFYREYADPREELERAGFIVEVAAGNTATCYPHNNSGQGNSRGGVTPDLALSSVDPSRYEAIVFSGGWGASMYQYAFRGRYDQRSYNGDAGKKEAANELINQFAKQDKYICGICNGVSVLAWSRVNGRSLLAGKRVTAPTRNAPSGIYNGQRATPSIRWHVQQNGGNLVPAGSIGNPNSRADDVAIDGKIITAEDDQSAREAGRQLAKLLQ